MCCRTFRGGILGGFHTCAEKTKTCSNISNPFHNSTGTGKGKAAILFHKYALTLWLSLISFKLYVNKELGFWCWDFLPVNKRNMTPWEIAVILLKRAGMFMCTSVCVRSHDSHWLLQLHDVLFDTMSPVGSTVWIIRHHYLSILLVPVTGS